MSKPPIARTPIPDIAALPEDIRARILTVQEKSGFIPNVFLMLAHRPAEFRAFTRNQCQYCVVAHGAILRIRAKHALIADQIAANWRKADITPKQKAMLEFALKVTDRANEVNDSDHEALRAAGFDDEAIWDIAAIAAFFGMSNRLANVTNLRPNDEFYAMGRG